MPSLGHALYSSGQLERTLEFLDEAAARATHAGADTIAARVAIQRALVRTHLGPGYPMGPALTEIESYMATLEAAGDDLGLAEGWSQVGVFRFWLGDGAGALVAVERARTHAERAGSARLIRLTSNELLGPFIWGPVCSDEVVERASALIAEMEAAGNDSFEVLQSLAVAHAMRGEIDIADELFDRSLTQARELGSRLHLAAGHPHLEAWLLLGRYAEAERMATKGIEQLREMGEHGYLRDVVDLPGRGDRVTGSAG